MAGSKRSFKVKKVGASKSTIDEAELQRLVQDHKQISQILKESEKWISLSKARDPKVDRARLLEQMVAREKELASEIPKLRKRIKPRTSVQAMKPDPLGPVPDSPLGPVGPVWPTDEELWWLRFFATVFQRPWRDPGIWPKPNCPVTIGLVLADDGMVSSEILPPAHSQTIAQRNMTRLTSVDYDGISFAGCSIDVSQSDIYLPDRFIQASRLTFTFPPADCDGTLTYRLHGELTASPDVDADFGHAIAVARSRFYRDGDGTDPNAYYQYDWIRGLQAPPEPAYPIYRPFIVTQSISLSAGERAILQLAAIVDLKAAGGQASFSLNGSDAVGHLIVKVPLSGTEPGVTYTFTPS